VPVLDVDRIGLDAHLRMALLQVLARAPVRGRAPAVEQPGLGQHQRAGAHRGEPSHARRHAREPGEQRAIVPRLT
jgi:hypothetical protein